EDAKAANARARAVDENAVERIALHETELAANDLVQGARIARDVDLFDIDPGALIDLQDHVDGTGIMIAADARMDFGKGVTAGSRRIRQRIDGFLNQFAIVLIARLDLDQRAKGERIEFLDAR